jgi:diguanylate cyclase (GGDEF)-like protein
MNPVTWGTALVRDVQSLPIPARTVYWASVIASTAMTGWYLSRPATYDPSDFALGALIGVAMAVVLRAGYRAGSASVSGTEAAMTIEGAVAIPAVLLLPPPMAVALLLLSGSLSWLSPGPGREMRRGFNLTMLLLASTSTWAAVAGITGSSEVAVEPGLALVAALALAALVYEAVGSGITALMVTYAVGKHLRDFPAREMAATLPQGLAVSGQAMLFTLAWVTNPWVTVLGVPVLVMIHRGMFHANLRRMALTDVKTGLDSAGWWREQAVAALERSRVGNRSAAILISDIDLFKSVNDTYGHLVGDVVLAGVADASRRAIRGNDLAGRFGGEEFVFLLPNVTWEQALMVSERLRSSVAAQQIQTDARQEPLAVTVSVGVALYPRDGSTLDEVLDAADRGVYAAKEAGRNRVCGPPRPEPVEAEESAPLPAA